MPRLMLSLMCAWSLVFNLGAARTAGAPQMPAPFQAAALGPADPVEVEAFIDGVMADQMAANHIPGAAVALVQDGRLVFTKGYGYADDDNQTPVDAANTLFRVGSISKLFVWTAVMQLAEVGKLSLDADVNTYLDFKIPATFPQPITLKTLMSHTAGFEDNGYKMYRLKPEELVPLGEYVKTRIPARIYPPGKVAAYSNYGASLAGYIVERISGVPFADYVEQAIFTPLGMAHSTFRQPLPANLAPGLSLGYNFYQDQTLQSGFEYVRDSPAGGMTSTAADMAQFMLAHLQNGQLGPARILQVKTAQQMHSELFSADPRLPGMAYGFMEDSRNGQRLLIHAGDTTFFSAGLYLIPDQALGLFIAANAPSGVIARNMLIQSFMDRYFPAALDPAPAPAADFASRMAPFAGTYYASRNNYTTPAKVMATMQAATVSLGEGVLNFSLPGKTFHLVEIEPGLLRDRNDPNFKMVVHLDEAGQASLLFPGPNFAFIKVPWYVDITFITLLIVLAVGLFSFMLIDWVKGAYQWLRKRRPAPMPPGSAVLSGVARGAGALFGVVAFLGVAGVQIGLTSVDASLGVPAYTFGEPPMFNLLPILAYVMAGLAALMAACAVLAWARQLWSLGRRAYYSALTLSALSMLWVFWFWNLQILLK